MSFTHSRRPALRLPRESYSDQRAIFFVTIGVLDRARVFDDGELARAVIDVLRLHAARTDVKLFAYCIMPDHVHLLVSPSTRCDVVDFVGQFKSLAARESWGHGIRGTFWQSSFWDHRLRTDESGPRVVEYILANPVRAGLVSDWTQYPFSGALASAGDEPPPHRNL